MDEIDGMIGNFDDLDNDLFEGVLKNKNAMTELRNPRGKDNQKKVVFPDFDDDTSLDDLLSDGNDSTGNLKPALTEAKASKAADLFKLDSTESRGVAATLPIVESSPRKNTPRDYRAEKSSIMDKPTPADPPKSLEMFENSGNDVPVSRVPDKAKKSLLMNDLFGSRARASSLKDITKNPSKRQDEPQGLVSESMPNLLGRDQGGKSSSSGFTLTSSNVREPRRGRAKSTVLDDPLGFLASSNVLHEAHSPEKGTGRIEGKSEPQEDLPEWLGGTKKSEKSGESKVQTVPKETENNISSVPNERVTPHSELSQLTEAEFEQQAALIALQQQEHELRTATLLSNQTEQFNSIIERQRNQLNEQEKTFNMLVKRQMGRQATLDMEIKMQQAKIDHYIQVLARQPIQASLTLHKDNEEDSPAKEILREDVKVEPDSLIYKLEIEKQNLERIIEILNEKHEKEIKILEDSYETQMHFMRTSLERLETKLREDTETSERDYEKKIERLVNEKHQLEELYKEQINNLKKEHREEITEIHDRHIEQLALVQREHSGIIGNVLHAKELEKKTVDFMQLNKNNLEIILDKSKMVFDHFQSMNDELKAKADAEHDKKENRLMKQEEELRALREQLLSQQESLDSERRQLIIVADNLRTETSQVSQQFQKNSELYRETESRLNTREKALIKERELFQEQSQWERDHLQYLKELWMTEQKRQLQQLAADREAIAAERAKLEIYNHLKTNSDDITKIELEVAMRAAHEATRSANLERIKWQEKIAAYEADQEKIRDKEKQLMERAKELETLTQSAILKREEGLKALREAHRIEKRHKERMSQLEMQLEVLAERENKVANEKLSLARDRLAIKIHHDKPEKDISNKSFHSQMHQPYYPSQVQTHFKDVVDPQLLLLKLNIDNNLDTSNQLVSDMQTVD